MHAQLTHELIERHGSQFGFILLMAGRAAHHCRCGKLSCTACGFSKFNQRVLRIQRAKHPITTGYLTGGPANKAMI